MLIMLMALFFLQSLGTHTLEMRQFKRTSGSAFSSLIEQKKGGGCFGEV